MGIIPADFICVLVILLAGITYFSYCHEVQVVIDFDQLPGRYWCILEGFSTVRKFAAAIQNSKSGIRQARPDLTSIYTRRR